MVDASFREIFHVRTGTPRPFLKWAGGKGQLLAELSERVRRRAWSGTYHEVFVGGGALFFELVRSRRVRTAVLCDTNPNLVEVYQAVRDHVSDVIVLLEYHRRQNSAEYFYAVRDDVPRTAVERAARVIYLNKTCFNGLYRENSKGRFNVPYGRYTNPAICDAANLRATSEALQGVTVDVADFSRVVDRARPGDFVYFDPPYVPLSATSSFTAYARGGFGEAEQRRLGEVFAELTSRGILALLSNSAAPLVREIYAGFPIEEVQATRAVNSRADRRGKVVELMVNNFYRSSPRS